MADLPNPFTTSASIVERSAEAPAVVSVVAPSDAAAECFIGTDHIGEIFVGARKLVDPDEHRFVLDVERFMAELDEAPLFLRQAV